MNDRPRIRLKGIPFNRMIPNILTLLALCAGMSAIRYSLNEQWEHAAMAILVAAILDALDGRVARILKGTSKFGAELDSLSDFISFGVAPPIILFLWTMKDAGRVGWVLVLLFAICCALRLARFNTKVDEPDSPPWAYNFFSGVPSPAGAGLVLLPLMLSFLFGESLFGRPEVVGTVLAVVSFLLVSRIPTYAFKKFKVAQRWIIPTMLGIGLFAAFFVSDPWAALSIFMLTYMCTIPFSFRSFTTLKRRAEELQQKPTEKYEK
jgi:CDP-diacylglycerol---serine O-phosphatidyltransferase